MRITTLNTASPPHHAMCTTTTNTHITLTQQDISVNTFFRGTSGRKLMVENWIPHAESDRITKGG